MADFQGGNSTDVDQLLDAERVTLLADQNERIRQHWIQQCGMPEELTYEQGKVWVQESQAKEFAAKQEWNAKVAAFNRQIEQRQRDRLLTAGFTDDELEGGCYVPCQPDFVAANDPRWPKFKDALRESEIDQAAMNRALGINQETPRYSIASQPAVGLDTVDAIAAYCQQLRQLLCPSPPELPAMLEVCMVAERLDDIWGAMRRIGGTVPDQPIIEQGDRSGAWAAFMRDQPLTGVVNRLNILFAIDSVVAWCDERTASAKGSGPEGTPPAESNDGKGADAPKGKRHKRGGKRTSDPKADKKLVECWKASGESKKAFARKNNVTPKELSKANERERYRQRRKSTARSE